MGLLDFFKPIKGEDAKAANIPVGGYEGAARYSRERSFIYDSADPQAFGNAPAYAREELLSLTRYAVNNFPVVERIIQAVENYAVGVGITAQAATNDSLFNDSITAYFDEWAASPFCSINHDINFYDIQKIVCRELLIAGECFLVLTKSETNYPQLILVSAEQVKSSGKKTDKSIDGIFYDSVGKATSYNIYFEPKKATVIGAENVIHFKRTKQPNQRRGVSAFAASINSLRDLYDILRFEKQAVKIHSTLAATITKQSGDASEGVFSNGTKSTCPSRNVGLEQAFGGAVVYLNQNEKADLLSSQRTTDNLINHLKLLVNEVCLNLSLNYGFLVNPSDLTGPAVRFVLADADVFFKNMQDLLIYSGIKRIYTWVTASAINNAKVKKPTDVKYYTVNFVCPPSITIDRGREDSTTLNFIEKGLLSHDSYYSARGKNYKDELRQVAQEKKYKAELEKEYGISFDSEQVATVDSGE